MGRTANVPQGDTDYPIRYLSRERLIALVGEDAARRLVAERGGRYFRVPHPGSPECDLLAAVIGDACAAHRLAATLPGERVALPRRITGIAPQIQMLASQGLTAGEISRRLGCAVQYVWSILRARRQ